MSTRRALHTSALWDCAQGGRTGHMISNLFFMNANVYSMFLYTYHWFHARFSLCSLFFTSYWAHWQSTKSTGFSSVSCPRICDSLFGKNRWVFICVFWGGAPTKRNLLSFCHDENEADCPTAWDLLFKRLNHEKKIKSKTLSGKISSSWPLPCSQASILKCLYFKKVACQRSNLSASVFFPGRCLILYPGQARFLSLLKPLMPNSTRLVLHVVTVYNTTLYIQHSSAKSVEMKPGHGCKTYHVIGIPIFFYLLGSS